MIAAVVTTFSMNKRHKCMNAWTHERMDAWTHECKNERPTAVRTGVYGSIKFFTVPTTLPYVHDYVPMDEHAPRRPAFRYEVQTSLQLSQQIRALSVESVTELVPESLLLLQRQRLPTIGSVNHVITWLEYDTCTNQRQLITTPVIAWYCCCKIILNNDNYL